ncbi:MAG: hypothetical protein KKH08_02840 [Candidatus Omnitrophica bacterium]|nr:hypothetical protein [Candidatus Omnitrophota bacterium]
MGVKQILLIVGCLAVVSLMSGCSTLSGSGSYSGQDVSLDVSALLRFSDVPIPAGFKILDKESFAFQNDATRVALLKYVGSKSPDLVVSFYKDQMTMYNWSAINIIEYERRMLNYEKDTESCIITIEPKGGGSIVTIAISPKSRPMKLDKLDKSDR